MHRPDPTPPPKRGLTRLTRRAALRQAAAALASTVGAAGSATGANAWAAPGPGGPTDTDRPPLQIVGPWEIGGLDPARSGYFFNRLEVAETLVGAAADGAPLPALATGWRRSDDGLEWRFTLRPTARFHDGSAVTAAAVAQSLRRAQVAPALLHPVPIRSIEADGTGTVVIRLTQPFGGLLSQLAHSSTQVLAPSSHAADGRVLAIVGSGPYRVVSIEAPQQMEVAAFDGFDGPQPAIRRVRYLSAGRSETRALMADSGQADLAYGLDPASLRRLGQRPQLRIRQVTLPRTMILKLNAGLPSLGDVRVRRAMSLAIDRAGIAHALLRDPSLAATQLLPPTLQGWHNTNVAPLAFDLPEAAALLAQAGWRATSEGVRNARGEALALRLRTFADRPELAIVATALQAQWQRLGIAVQVSIANSGDVPLGHRDGSLELALAARNYATTPDPTATLRQDFGPQGGDWGAMGWSDPAVVAALAELGTGASIPARRAELQALVTATLQSQLPVIPVAWYRQQVAVSRRVEGVELDPLERSYRLTSMKWRA